MENKKEVIVDEKTPPQKQFNGIVDFTDIESINKLVISYLGDKLKEFSYNEIKQFVMLCMEYKLNPLKGEIYAIKYKDNPLQVVTNYYQYIKKADATGLLEFYNVEIEEENGRPTVGWFIAKRKDQTKELKMKFYFKEWTQGRSVWLTKPFFMFDKCIIANGMRRLFPNELANMPYVNEELWFWEKENEKVIEENIKTEEINAKQVLGDKKNDSR